MRTRRLPESVYNWVTVAGAVLAVTSFVVIVFLLLIDVYVRQTTIYLGLLTFIVLPAFLVVGLLLIPAGMLREKRRQQRGLPSTFPWRIHLDLADPANRNAFLIFILGTTIFFAATAFGTYNAYKSTESVEFCGALCHSVMQPEYTAYQGSPHARVACVECHIGEGADWYVKSKLSGAYQVYAVAAEVYPRPIPTPVVNLRPARETCERCHWPEKFSGGRQAVIPHFLPDEANTPYPITLLLKIGGASERTGQVEGIHWHVARSNRIDYLPRDDRREQIAWVRLTRADSTVKEYRDPGSTDPLPGAAALRTMDCIDCHNRPSHHYRSPNQTVNQALAAGQIDRTLPFVKQRAVMALDAQYPDSAAAREGIERSLREFYQSEYPAVAAQQGSSIAAAVVTVQGIYRRNFFPEMKVTWRQYPDHIGHSEFVGCFRCHGSALETTQGERISGACGLCHVILSQGTPPAEGTLAPQGLAFAHPEDIGGAEFETRCTECHQGGAELY